MAEKRIYGLGVSAGIGLGPAFLYRPHLSQQQPQLTEVQDIAGELARLQAAKEQCEADLHKLVDYTRETLGEEKSTIIKGQISFLLDPGFYPEMIKRVETRSYPAERAVQEVTEEFARIFEQMPNEYLRERAADIRDVGRRLLTLLQGGQQLSLAELDREVILVADDLTPSDTVQLNRNLVKGIVTRVGGKTSHTAILARSLGIPAILGVGAEIESINHSDNLLIDGQAGLCIINPEQATLTEYQEKAAAEQLRLQELQAFAHRPACTVDGKCFEIVANIGTPEEAELALEQGAEGIGLYRTEFLFMHREQMPDEEEQFQAYRRVAEIMGERPVIIRTLDIGGDKELPYLELEKEMNPFLGYRAIRIGLNQPQLLKTQLRAILRASVYGNIKIMFPMISSLEEWREARRIYQEAEADLKQEGKEFKAGLELGIMVEVPSAAVLAARFAKEVDFFSIGTNDLVQYTIAVDRMNEKVAYLYDYFHPAVLGLIKLVIDAAHREGKWVGMCGSMAGDPLAAPLLVGLGLDEWSMSAGSIKEIKRIIAGLDARACAELAERALQLNTTAEVRELLQTFHH
ncbi:phosphotransferase system, enzyme I, PtsI [Carboxydocella thermautotrophica]|nr:phosphotransferase system, enzyme I, PtsI [Carboxydocella thermautotrophica]